MSDDPRRQSRVVVAFRGEAKVGTVVVANQIWGAVEWSEKHGVWCIEDAEGQCLAHVESIHGEAASKEEAIALAERMVRDGTLPTPEEAKRRRREGVQRALEVAQRKREQRSQQPSEQRRTLQREHEREQRERLLSAWADAQMAEFQAKPFYAIFAEAFDLADPNLWKSNSFAMVRPRLVIEVRAAVATLASNAHRYRRDKKRREGIENKLARAR
jgi:hypothetical protein